MTQNDSCVLIVLIHKNNKHIHLMKISLQTQVYCKTVTLYWKWTQYLHSIAQYYAHLVLFRVIIEMVKTIEGKVNKMISSLYVVISVMFIRKCFARNTKLFRLVTIF